MQRLIVIILLLALGFGGYVLYRQWISAPSSAIRFNPPTNDQLRLSDPSNTLGNLESVLGTQIGSGVGAISDTISNLTDGVSEPIINQAISNFQSELSQLPKDQMQKIQYNYCKSIVEEYEKTQ